MTTLTGKVLKSAEHGGGTLRRGAKVTLPARTARDLARKGILQLLNDDAADRPKSAVGTKSSASPAVPASPPQTAKPSDDGGTSSPATTSQDPDPKAAKPAKKAGKRKAKKKASAGGDAQ